jgi:hypothetical protein
MTLFLSPWKLKMGKELGLCMKLQCHQLFQEEKKLEECKDNSSLINKCKKGKII